MTEAFLDVIATVLEWVFGIFPEYTMPEGFDSPPEMFVDTIANVGQIGNILPLGTLLLCLTAQVAIFGVAMYLRLSRLVVSVFTGGGAPS